MGDQFDKMIITKSQAHIPSSDRAKGISVVAMHGAMKNTESTGWVRPVRSDEAFFEHESDGLILAQLQPQIRPTERVFVQNDFCEHPPQAAHGCSRHDLEEG